jgi:hypothetical protein
VTPSGRSGIADVDLHPQVQRPDADAVAAAVADADAVADRYWRIRNAVYKAVYAKVREKADEIGGERSGQTLASALELMDRMLPPAPIKLPVIDYADVVCAAPEKAAA